MGLLNRLLGRKSRDECSSPGARQAHGLSSPNHPARALIDQASQIADDIARMSTTGNRRLAQVDGKEAPRLVAAIDKAIDKTEGDVDLLVVKSAALCCAALFKSSEEVIDEVLRLNPDHFEASMRKKYWNEWDHLFFYPSWSESRTELQPGMAEHLSLPHQMQVIRDGLQAGIAIVMRADKRDFPKGLSNKMACAWLPIWSDTPCGPIIAHYLAVKDDPANPYKNEAFLPVSKPEAVTASSGYWLLQRIAHLDSCYLVLTDGNNVMFNRPYVFPESLRSTLRTLAEKARALAGKSDHQSLQKAIQWYQNNSDISAIRIDM